MKIRFELDPELSLREKGTIIVCKQLLDKGINPTIENIKQNSKDAETSIGSSLHKLTDLGYYQAIRFKVKDGPGFNWKYEIQETREVEQ
jgi:predicted transcriptional regulator